MRDIVDSILIRLRGVQLAPDQAERIKQAVDARTVLPHLDEPPAWVEIDGRVYGRDYLEAVRQGLAQRMH